MIKEYMDIIVIGSGGAGLRAALAAYEKHLGLKVGLISNGRTAEDGITGTSSSDRMAFHACIDGSDDWKEHAKDIFEGGRKVSDPNLAYTLANGGREAFEYLRNAGVPWVIDREGMPVQFRTDGSRIPRALFTGPYTAIDIAQKLFEGVKRTSIQIIQNKHLVDIARSPETSRVWDCTFRDRDSGELMVFPTSVVILATGGPGGTFGSNLFHPGADAIPPWCALKNGASLVNLEFIQYGIVSAHKGLACSGTIPRSLPRVVNENDEEIIPTSMLDLLFLKGASWPVSVESKALPIDEAIWNITHDGGKVFLDFSRNPSGLDEALYNKIVEECWGDEDALEYAPTPLERLDRSNRKAVRWFRDRRLDPETEKIQIQHQTQHFQGGILIDESGSTGIPGLYACGEAAGGQHGAFRPGGNSLLDGQVMGRIAGGHAAEYAKTLMLGQIRPEQEEMGEDAGKINISDNGENALRVIGKVTNLMQSSMPVFRSKNNLETAKAELEEMAERGLIPDDDLFALNSAWAAINIARQYVNSTLMRNESRGSHILKETRNDKPLPLDENWSGRWIRSSMDSEGKISGVAENVPELKKEWLT